MGFNVTGQEVASGVHDPTIMFITAAVIIIVAAIGYVIYYTLTNIK